MAIGADHFSKQTRNALAKRGIYVAGITALPGRSGTFLDSVTGYELNDNGCHRIRTYLEVKAIAEGATI